MRTLVYFTASLLWFGLMIGLAGGAAAQCVIDSTLSDGPRISPPAIPTAAGCEYYEESISFVLPQDSFTSGVTATFIDFVIDSLSGLPEGIDWVCNLAPGCRYVVHPDSAHIDTLGCVTFFGTPEIPATYQVTISLTATFRLLGRTVSDNVTFALPFSVTPCTFTGECYTLTADNACEPVALSITNNVRSQGNDGYHYNMSLTGDNGFSYQTRDEVPADQVLTAGTYIFNYNLAIDTVGYLLSGATIDAINCTDLIGLNNPDIYWVLKDDQGNTLVNTANNPITVDENDDLPFNTGITNLSLPAGLYEFQVWDDDGNNDQGCATGSTGGGTASVFFAIPGPTGQQTISNGGLTVTLLIDQPVQNVACADTFTISAVPNAPIVWMEDQVTPAENMVVCAGTTEILYAAGDSIRWLLDGQYLDSTQGNTLTVTDPGTYQAVAVDPQNFCETASTPVAVVVPSVPAPSIGYNGSRYEVARPSANFQYEWVDENNVVAGTGPAFIPTRFGAYGARAVDLTSGCVSEVSAQFVFVPTNRTGTLPEGAITLAPNPVTTAFQISNRTTRSLAGELQLLSLQGQVIRSQTTQWQPGMTITWDRQQLAAGLYLLQFSGEGVTWQAKVYVK